MMNNELVVENNPKSPITEIFKNLRTNLQFINSGSKLKTVLVTSTLPGEGKSWVSANLATTFSQAGKVVCLIDADMRKGRQHKIFDCKKTPGLSNYLSGFYNGLEDKDRYLANYLQETTVKNLFLITAGNVPPNPSELLVSENMMSLLDNLTSICDVVIVDGPPSQLVTDSIILSRIVDSTVIVVESKKTKKENLHEIVNSINNVGGKIAGVVINKAEVSNKDYRYTYYYGHSNKDNKKNKKNSDHQIENEGEDIYRVDELIHKEGVRQETIKKEQVVYEEKKKQEAIKAQKTEQIRNMLEEQAIKKEQEKELARKQAEKEEKERKERELLDRQRREQELLNIRNQLRENSQVHNNIQENNAPANEFAQTNNNMQNDNIQNNEADAKTEDILRQIDDYANNEGNNLNN